MLLITDSAVSAHRGFRCWKACLEPLHLFTAPRLGPLNLFGIEITTELRALSVKHLYHIELAFVWHSCYMFRKSRFRFLARRLDLP
jgi:hypothetical protein